MVIITITCISNAKFPAKELTLHALSGLLFDHLMLIFLSPKFLDLNLLFFFGSGLWTSFCNKKRTQKFIYPLSLKNASFTLLIPIRALFSSGFCGLSLHQLIKKWLVITVLFFCLKNMFFLEISRSWAKIKRGYKL